MRDFITQPIPGYLSPDDQVAIAIHVIQSAAELLMFSECDQLGQGLAMIQKQLLSLVAAGSLCDLILAIHDFDSDCGVTISFEPYDMEEFEEVDLTRLRLAASTTGIGRIELVCLDGAVTDAFSQLEWLPPSHPNLAWCQVQQSESREDSSLLGEEQ
jgi:hypothetical protein